MADMTTVEMTVDACCTTEHRATCCELSAKKDCCGHGEGCGCSVGSTQSHETTARER